MASSCFVPALFGHAIEDDFIHPHHSDRIFEAYMVYILGLVIVIGTDMLASSRLMAACCV